MEFDKNLILYGPPGTGKHTIPYFMPLQSAKKKI